MGGEQVILISSSLNFTLIYRAGKEVVSRIAGKKKAKYQFKYYRL